MVVVVSNPSSFQAYMLLPCHKRLMRTVNEGSSDIALCSCAFTFPEKSESKGLDDTLRRPGRVSNDGKASGAVKVPAFVYVVHL